ncbi:MAG: pyrroloquinoline-quinone synthase PqqC [Terrimicrobiaceae bacterium]|nr:pyrroloquinoline-quinone synthase PqqC [Terrimicrobiaceae bacterium]
MTSEEFPAALRAVGERGYHHLHPFHVRMNAGELSPGEIRTWVANRFYYQRSIPLKDAAILSNCSERDVRRVWLHRIVDHDGAEGVEDRAGGIEAWLRLAEGCGLERGSVLAGEGLLPGVRFAVDAYVNFARTQPWQIAVASSLTELFAPDLMAERLAAFRCHYTWVPDWAFDYFQSRVTQARVDSEEALSLTLRWCDTPELRRRAVGALRFKCDVLWSLLDAIAAHAC